VWGRVVKIIHTKGHLGLKRKRKLMTTLPCYKKLLKKYNVGKKERKNIYDKKEKREK
jgi:hypothetical protein